MKYELYEIRNLYYKIFERGHIRDIKQMDRWCKRFEEDLRVLGCWFQFDIYYSTNFDVVSVSCSPNGDNKRYDLFEFIYHFFNPNGVYLLEKMALDTI